MSHFPPLAKSVEGQFRQRGFNDAYYGRDTSAGESVAERTSPEALQAYRMRLRTGRRQREREVQRDG